MYKGVASDARRRFLIATSSAIGAVGAVVAAVPFVKSWQPSAKARALGAPVVADISKLEVGQRMTVEWRGKPVWILCRSEAAMESLNTVSDRLRDPQSKQSNQPEYATGIARSRPEHKNIIVLVGVCTHLGCSPLYRPDAAPADLGPDWVGGFFCPCHGSKFDLSGRVFKAVPAPANLEIPPYHYMSENLIKIGEDGEAA